MDNRNTPFQNLLLAAEYRQFWTRTLHVKRHEFVAQEGDAKGPWMFYERHLAQAERALQTANNQNKKAVI